MLVLKDLGNGHGPVWTCDGCKEQLTSNDLHGTSEECSIEHTDDCPVIAGIRGTVDDEAVDRVRKAIADPAAYVPLAQGELTRAWQLRAIRAALGDTS